MGSSSLIHWFVVMVILGLLIGPTIGVAIWLSIRKRREQKADQQQ